ncbi:hypothetical protein MAR_005597 [Mya arenaria]|uniref:Uncharacterized protein n=1 Tax=Mya arenaria TaxID=6604 RepID=A0ABY7F352_MYAAR|nr:hypothetical protein MAR_005597 [Mya arenaria]
MGIFKTHSYRDKNEISQNIKGKEFGFDDIKWSFFEAGHGKGVPDAIGGAVKRRADNVLKYGGDIISAAIVFTTLSEDFNVKMYLVKEEWIEEKRTLLINIVLKPVSGTLNFHQVICDFKEGQITYKHLSCLCKIDSEHIEIEVSVKADEINVYQTKLEVDIESVVDIPDDLKMPDYVEDLYAVEVNTNGNCLPSCGSVYAFGNPDRPEEIRTRIIKELLEKESYYLNNENLVKVSENNE